MPGLKGIGLIELSRFQQPEPDRCYFQIRFNRSMLDPSVERVSTLECFRALKATWREDFQDIWSFVSGEESLPYRSSFSFGLYRDMVTPKTVMTLLDMCFHNDDQSAVCTSEEVYHAFLSRGFTVANDIVGTERNCRSITEDLIFLTLLPLDFIRSLVRFNQYVFTVHMIPEDWSMSESERRQTVILEVALTEPLRKPRNFILAIAKKLGVPD